MPDPLQQAREAAADLQARDETADPIEDALAAMRAGQAAGLARIGLGPPATPATDTPTAPPDFGGGVRGQAITPGGPSMNDALKALLRSDRGY